MDVLTYLCRGVPTNGIARALGITMHTCRSYLKSVYAKLGVTNQLEAVIKANGLGLIEAPAPDPSTTNPQTRLTESPGAPK